MRLISALVLSFLVLNGCDRLSQLAQQSEVIQKQGEELKILSGNIDNLEKRLNDLQSNYDGIKSHCNKLQRDLSALQIQHEKDMNELLWNNSSLEYMINKDKSITCNATSKGFQRLDTDLGAFLISVDGVTPYLNGYKLNLRIGNPSMCKFGGFTLKVKWGEDFTSKGKLTYQDWKKSLISKDEKFTEDLECGRWNKVDLVLAPAKPEQLEHIEIEMEVDRVLLITDH
jgi:prefoldin subunit 5